MPALDPIQGLWIGKALTSMEQLSIRSFLANGHPYHLYLYRPVEGLPHGVATFDANQIIPEQDIFYYQQADRCGSPSGFSNLFRYKLLHERGGWWCDLDVVCLRPFEFPGALVLCGQRRRTGWPRRMINTAVIRAPKRSPLMESCYRRALAAGRSIAWGTTGPRLLSRQFYFSWFPRQLLRLHWAPRCVQAPDTFQPVDWWRVRDLVAPEMQWNLSLSHAVHLFNEMWRRFELQKDASYDPRCLYEQLKSRFPSGI